MILWSKMIKSFIVKNLYTRCTVQKIRSTHSAMWWKCIGRFENGIFVLGLNRKIYNEKLLFSVINHLSKQTANIFVCLFIFNESMEIGEVISKFCHPMYAYGKEFFTRNFQSFVNCEKIKLFDWIFIQFSQKCVVNSQPSS